MFQHPIQGNVLHFLKDTEYGKKKKKVCSTYTVVQWVHRRTRTNPSSDDVQECQKKKKKQPNVVLAKVGGLVGSRDTNEFFIEKEKERQENIINIQECIWRRSKTLGIMEDAMKGIKMQAESKTRMRRQTEISNMGNLQSLCK